MAFLVKCFFLLSLVVLSTNSLGFAEISPADGAVLRRQVEQMRDDMQRLREKVDGQNEILETILEKQKELKETLQEEHKQIRYFVRRN